MRERGRRLRNDDDAVRPRGSGRQRPNRLSDEARPNVLTGSGEVARNNAAPSWVRAVAAQRGAAQRGADRRVAAQRAVAPQRGPGPAAGTDGTKPAQSRPNWFTLVVAGFIALSILRACLQLG